MKKFKPKVKKLATFFLSGFLLLIFSSCEKPNDEDFISIEQQVSWNEVLNALDLESDIVFVQNGESIQEAINASISGDVIYIEPGRYMEDLTINKSNITLVGLSLSPNDFQIPHPKNSPIDILKLYDQKSTDDFRIKSKKRGKRGRISDFSRTDLGSGIAHYQFKIRLGKGEFDVIRIHRVILERRPYHPIHTNGEVFMVHGALAGFENTFFSAGLESKSDINEETSSPFYLAMEGIDVWGIDLGWTMVPPETENFSFFEGWGFEKDIDHTLKAMRIARCIRGISGQGFSGINLLGFSSGATIAYGAASRETQMRNMKKRHIKGLIPVDNAFKIKNGENQGCTAAAGFKAEINASPPIYQNTFGSFFSWAGSMALAAPTGDSPIIPGLNNSQALRILFSSPEDAANGVYFHFFGGDISTFYYSEESRIFSLAASYSPFMPNQIWYEFNALNCSSENVTFDNHLESISVPMLNINAGGGSGFEAGNYTSQLTASNDIQNHFVTKNSNPAADFGHVDIWLANEADVLVWLALGNWIKTH